MEEIWKDINGFDGLYQISSFGKVRSNNYRHTGETRELKLYSKHGYMCVDLYYNGDKKTLKVHRLVAEAFLPNPNNLPQVSHLDETRTNNRTDNLEWSTAKDNCNMPKHKERLSKALPFEKMSKSQDHRKKEVLCLDDGKIYESAYDAARNLGLYPSAISACCRGLISQTGGYHFDFTNQP